MKKIKGLTHLALEQERLAHRRLALEKDIRKDWTGIRHAFEPAGLAREAFFSGLSWVGQRLFPIHGASHNMHKHSS